MITNETTTLGLSPWTLSGFSIDWIQLKEEVGGNLPCGKVSLTFNRTEAEYDKMSDKDIENNMDLIMKSMSKW